MYNEFIIASRVLHSNNVIMIGRGLYYAYGSLAESITSTFHIDPAMDNGHIFCCFNEKEMHAVVSEYNCFVVQVEDDVPKWRTAMERWLHRHQRGYWKK
jgi:hypothetical protein